MGRRKLEMKRIEDKNSRHVAFSKRRAGLVNKARQLSVLCDADAAVIVFSSVGNLYENCSGSTDRSAIALYFLDEYDIFSLLLYTFVYMLLCTEY
ncbi:hypothetical protein L1887_24551 [Cichorium endivia]|nr:hypothetical protein L1887_24551 [Cichorium endivia]